MWGDQMQITCLTNKFCSEDKQKDGWAPKDTSGQENNFKN